MINWIWNFLGILLVLITFPGTLELCLLTIGGLLPRPRSKMQPTTPEKCLVIVPAFNEEKRIFKTLKSLQVCKVDCLVIADNCTDRTAAIAKEFGVEVLERHDLQKQGKNFALEDVFPILLKKPYDYFYIIDADTIVNPNLISETYSYFLNGADALQVYYGVLNAEENIRTRLMNVAFLAFNRLRPRGRQTWGFSAGIFGNGFALTRRTLQEVPYQADSIVEDLAYHLRLIAAGKKVQYTDETYVLGEMPASGHGVFTQRSRWEGGRLRTAIKEIPFLIKQMYRGNWLAAEPLLDLLLLPLTYHVLLLLLLLLIPFSFGRIYASFSLGVVFLHLMAALAIAKAGLRDYTALLMAPFYLVWKIGMLIPIYYASKKDSKWIRTERK